MLLMISMTATGLKPLDFAYASSKEFLDIQATIKFVFTLKLVRDMTRTYNDLNGEEIIRTFSERELQKTDQQKFRMEKVIKKKDDKLYVKWKGYDSSFNSWIDKKDLVWCYRIKMSQYFPKPYEQFDGDINVKVDLSNYATKTDLRNISHADTWSFALKSNLASLKLK